MKSTRILTEEIGDMKISSLPTRPTAPKHLGGGGYTSLKMKEAFDKLPLFIISRFNALIDDIEDGAIAHAIPTGIDPSHTLGDLANDVKNGNLASYLDVGGVSLMTVLLQLDERIKAIEEK